MIRPAISIRIHRRHATPCPRHRRAAPAPRAGNRRSGAAAFPAASFGAPCHVLRRQGRAQFLRRGCDRWIAVEGQINADAAGRFKTFIKQHLKDRHLPIYFSSPGGNLEQAIFIGNMLREMSAVARVARTIVKDCGFEAQTSDVCLKLKRSGRELAGDLTTRSAQCNSACPYLMLGAPVREVAPDAILGVHSPKVVLRVQRRSADQGDGCRGDAARRRARRPVAVKLCFQDGHRRRIARRCQAHQIRGHARPHP